MAHVPPERANAFGADLFIAFEASRARVIPKTQTGKQNTWNLWEIFCEQHGQDAYLSKYVLDKLDFFIVFALRYRRGDIAKNSRGLPITDGPGVRAQAVKTALTAVGERFTELGSTDPRLLQDGKHLVPRLAWLYTSFDNEDPPASRIWPVTLTILRSLRRRAELDPDPVKAGATVDLCILAFFFLCRPGEYPVSSQTDQGRSSPFFLADVHFATADTRNASAATCTLNDVKHALYVALTYTDQKNAVRGEAIGHHSNSDSIFNPVAAVRRRVLHLRSNNAPPDTPLYTYYSGGATHSVTTLEVTRALRAAAQDVVHVTGIPAERVQAYSLRSGGATALLCAHTSADVIQIIGRWKSDAMFRYLRTQALELTAGHSQDMLNHGAYTFAPSSSTDPDLLPVEVHKDIRQALGPLTHDKTD